MLPIIVIAHSPSNMTSEMDSISLLSMVGDVELDIIKENIFFK